MRFELNIETAMAAVEKNLREHVEELKEATEVWTAMVKEELDRFRDAIDRKGLETSHENLYKLFYSRPKDNRKNYSKYLGAMKRAAGDGQSKITVDEDDYDRIFNDNWEWRIESRTSNAAYRR